MIKKTGLKKCFLFILFFFLGISLSGQEAASLQQTGDQSPAADQTTPKTEKIRRILFIDNSNASKNTDVLLEFVKGLVAGIDSIVLSDSAAGADAVLSISPEGALELRDKLIKEPENPVIYSSDLSKSVETSDFSIGELTQNLFPELEKSIREQLPPRAPEVVEVVKEKIVENIQYTQVVKKISVRVTGENGIKIKAGTGEQKIIENNETILEFSPNSSASLRITRKGYVPQTIIRAVQDEDIEIPVQLEKIPGPLFFTGRLFMWEAQLNPAMEYYLYPGYVYAYGEIAQNILSVASIARGFSLLHSPYIEPSIGMGCYLNPPDKITRFAFQTGFFTRFVKGSDGWYLSRINTFGIDPAIRMENHSLWNLNLFVELSLRIFYSSLASNQEISDYVDTATLVQNMGGHWFIQIQPMVNLGIRYRFSPGAIREAFK